MKSFSQFLESANEAQEKRLQSLSNLETKRQLLKSKTKKRALKFSKKQRKKQSSTSSTLSKNPKSQPFQQSAISKDSTELVKSGFKKIIKSLKK